MYTINNPEKYKEIYTKSNAKRKEYKRQWYLKNKEKLKKLKEAQ